MNFFFATSVILAANAASAQLATRHRRHRRAVAETNDAAFDQEAGMSMPSDLSMSLKLSTDAIVGGTTSEGKPDYLVSLNRCGDEEDGPCSNSHDCSGVLISSNVILTSAGCMVNSFNVESVGDDGIPLLGEPRIEGGWVDFFREDIRDHDFKDQDGIVRYYFSAEDVVVSEDHVPNIPQFDVENGVFTVGRFSLDSIALAFLRYPAPLGTEIIELSKNAGAPDAEDALNVIGWDTFSQAQLSSTLPVKYISNDECIAEIERYDGPPGFLNITDKQLCANSEPGKGTCLDERGSPLIRDGKYLEGIWARPLANKDPRNRVFPKFYFTGWNSTALVGRFFVLSGVVENIFLEILQKTTGTILEYGPPFWFLPFEVPSFRVNLVDMCEDGTCTLVQEIVDYLESDFRELLTKKAEECEEGCEDYPDDSCLESCQILFDSLDESNDFGTVETEKLGPDIPFGTEPCATTEFPAIYTRISSYKSWIEKTICGRTGEFCKKRSSKASK